MMGYKYLEELAYADVAFEATGKTLDELFESAGLAVTGIMVQDRKKLEAKVKREVKKQAETIEKLLFDFLDELIFLKDAEQLIFGKFEAHVKGKEGAYELIATLSGEKINPKKHQLIVDAKAITMHQFEVKKTKEGWKAQVVVDV